MDDGGERGCPDDKQLHVMLVAHYVLPGLKVTVETAGL